MNKGELVDSIAKSCELSKAEAGRALSATLGAIEGELKKGNDVQIIGFGTFKVVPRKARMAKNPQTGAPIKVAARKIARFTPGKSLKDTVNGVKKSSAAKAPAKKAGAKKAGKKK